MSEETRRYEEWLLRTVTTAVAEGVTSLRAIVDRCQGADPLTVRSAMMVSGAQGRCTVLDAPNHLDGSVETALPPPHPLDFEWRFSREGAATLVKHAGLLGGGDLLMMGATTVAIAAGRACWRGRVVALDQSTAVVEAAKRLGLPVEFLVGDVSGLDLTGATFDVVVIDPPWYLEYAKAFIHAAAQACRTGGHVLASLPGDGTRPGVAREREELLAWCSLVGLEFVTALPQSVPYETPLFERNSLRAAGLSGDVRSWRRGDLWVLRRLKKPLSVAIVECKPLHGWQELGVGSMRLRFRDVRTVPGDTRLTTLIDGDILPSVSRRDSRRELVQVWTSGNRVFGCADPETLLAAASARAASQDEIAASAKALGRQLTDTERNQVLDACDRLVELSHRERDEQSEDSEKKERSEGVAA